MTEYAFEGPKRANTTVTWSFATQTFPADASYSISDPIAPVYQSTIEAALNRWASVAGLSFTQVPDAPSVQVRIGFGTFSTPAIVGQTAYQRSGAYFAPDTVVRLLDPAALSLLLNAQGAFYWDGTDVTLYQVALHEIGHSLGLDHSTDPSTNMYAVATAANPDLAAGDIEGINALYPLYTVVALDPVQVKASAGATTTYYFTIARYSDPSTAVTLNYNVVGAAYAGVADSVAASVSEFAGNSYPSGQLTFAAGVASVTLAVNVPGNTTPQPDEGFSLALSSTSNTATVRGLTSAVTLDDDGYGSINGSTLGIYRFFDTVDGTHFFTASEQERNMLILTRPDLTYEGIRLTAVANPSQDPAATAVFRFFDLTQGTHFYTASATERDTVMETRSDLAFEGVAFYEDASPRGDDTAVYRFFDTQNGTHFYTSSASERASIFATRPDLQDEGVGFYAPLAT